MHAPLLQSPCDPTSSNRRNVSSGPTCSAQGGRSMKAFKAMFACAALGGVLLVSNAAVLAHDAKQYHVHGGASLAPDFESFAIVWYPDIPYATAPNTDPHLLSLDIHMA